MTGMIVYVSDASHKVAVEVGPSDSVQHLVDAFEKATGRTRVRLTFQGSPLREADLLADTGLSAQAVVHAEMGRRWVQAIPDMDSASAAGYRVHRRQESCVVSPDGPVMLKSVQGTDREVLVWVLRVWFNKAFLYGAVPLGAGDDYMMQADARGVVNSDSTCDGAAYRANFLDTDFVVVAADPITGGFAFEIRGGKRGFDTVPFSGPLQLAVTTHAGARVQFQPISSDVDSDDSVSAQSVDGLVRFLESKVREGVEEPLLPLEVVEP
eukprot:TRINITY_DN3768_c0_g1_i3.p1 TRINITY_DN3768_c0_g1~~TRINITY_DN3768_c0_g1_i3.p1  ORF type:complete len:267 (+),score=89.58 TRINITY_DN3768_c0_g1_i3:28-828(+)